MRWGAPDWNQGKVTTKRVQKAKKNKGKKRVAWMAEVKAYHDGRGKGHSKGAEVKTEPKTFPEAPWWKTPVQETTTIHDDDTEEEEEPPMNPFLDKPGQNGNGNGGDGTDDSMSKLKIFGP